VCRQLKIESETIRVRFAGYGDDSMDISVRVFALTTDWNDYYAQSQTVYLERSDGPDESRGKQSVEEVAAWRQSGQLPFPEFAPEKRAELDDTLDYPPAGSPDACKD
jgi:MscS family membrane protein